MRKDNKSECNLIRKWRYRLMLNIESVTFYIIYEIKMRNMNVKNSVSLRME